MPTNVLMPQMGESVAEGTIVRWIKHVGDAIDKDEPLFEISTDKVDAEIPSPNAGVLLEIRVKEGETVPVNSVVAVIGAAGESHAVGGSAADHVAPETPLPPSTEKALHAQASHAGSAAPVASAARLRSSPVVRKIAKEQGIDIGELTGTGIAGRVSKRDIQAFIDRGGSGASVARDSGAARPAAFVPGEHVRIEKMSIMRRKIAEHMVMSVHTSPHVYSTYEVDFWRVDELRQKHKAAYEAAGVKLTYTAFVVKATVDTIREFPFTNASLDGENIVFKEDINLGIAVALDQGLIVPVLRTADRRGMLDLCRAIQDLASRARTKQLRVDEVQGGTFTITNPGTFGALMGFPIISQPQVAILAVGAIEKRAVVVDDAVVVRPRCYLTLGHDHRLIDGADAGRFLQALKHRLQTFDDALL